MTSIATRATTASIGGSPQTMSLPGGIDNQPDRANAPTRQLETADLREIKIGTIWNVTRLAREHLDRLAWALNDGDDGAIRDQCRATVSHVKAVVLLVNDLSDGGGR